MHYKRFNKICKISNSAKFSSEILFHKRSKSKYICIYHIHIYIDDTNTRHNIFLWSKSSPTRNINSCFWKCWCMYFQRVFVAACPWKPVLQTIWIPMAFNGINWRKLTVQTEKLISISRILQHFLFSSGTCIIRSEKSYKLFLLGHLLAQCPGLPHLKQLLP